MGEPGSTGYALRRARACWTSSIYGASGPTVLAAVLCLAPMAAFAQAAGTNGNPGSAPGDGATLNLGGAQAVQGGNGGPGGAGGNGGSGGPGVTGNGLTINSTGAIVIGGGNGGAGGAGANGGSGGTGVVGNGVIINNTAAEIITGGRGGTAGPGGAGGVGGNGVVGDGITITNQGALNVAGGQGEAGAAGGIGIVGSNVTVGGSNNALGVEGGLADAGNAPQNYAIQFTGGTNFVGTNTTINGGINVLAGSFQPALPGSAVGTPLAVNGPLSFAPGSIYGVRLTPTANDSVAATGTATPGGATVSVTAGGGPIAPGTTYTLITATGGVNGTFSGVTSNLAFFAPTLSYDATDVFLTAAFNYAAAGVTQNQRAVGAGLNNAARLNGGGGALLTGLDQVPAGQGGAVLDSLSGEGIAATQNLAHREAGMFTSAIFDQTTFYGAGGGNQIVLTAPQPGFVALAPQDTLKAAAAGKPIRELADLPRPAFVETAPVAPTRTWRAWGTGFGANEDIHSNAAIGYAAQMNTIYGGAVGVDYQVAPGTLLGLAAGGSDGAFNVPNRATSGSTTGGHIAGYSLASFGPAYGAFSASGSFFQNRTTRNVGGFGGLGSETEKGNFSSREVRVRLEAGRGFAAGAYGTLTPFVALEIASLRSDGFTEQGIAGPGLFALNVAGQSAADVPAFVGLRYATVTTLGNGMLFKPVIQAAYVHEFAPYRQLFAGIASLPGAVFLVDGARPARDAAQVKAGGELAIGPRSAIFANFDGEFARANQLYGGKGGIKVAF